MFYPRSHLRAIIAIWMTNGNVQVDGANEPREYCSGDWWDAQQHTEDLVADGFCEWADPERAKQSFRGGGTYSDVVPTAKGIYEALS